MVTIVTIDIIIIIFLTYLIFQDGASTDPCSEVYRGSEASSELEVTAVTDFITDTGMVTGFDMLVTLHSFGKILLYPWAYTDAEDPEDIDDLVKNL